MNYAFIDSQNLYRAIRRQGWWLDFKKFRQYLKDKYNIVKAIVFVGYIKENEFIYEILKNADYEIVFKPILHLPDGKIKGNVDAELVLHTMIELENYDKALIVSNDGDFYCLAEYLSNNEKLLKIMIPDMNRYSQLLQKFGKQMVFMNNLKDKLEYKKRGINLRTEP